MNRNILTLSLVIFLTGILSYSCVSDDEPDEDPVQIGSTIPEFTVTLTDGTSISSGNLRGSRSMIVFFYTLCPDCQAELPEIQKVYDAVGCEPGTHPDGKTQLLCISREENKASVEDYWQSTGFTMPVSAQDDRQIFELFASRTVPRIYVVSPDLKVTEIFIEEKIEAEKLLSVLGY